MIDIATRAMTSLADVEVEMHRRLGRGQVADAACNITGGRRWTGSRELGVEAAEILNLGDPIALACACGPELLHNASLMHDDLQDRDETRRGQPAVWRRFGRAAAISIGDLMVSAAYAALASHPDPARCNTACPRRAVAHGVRTGPRSVARGPASVDAYRAMVADKTGALIALPVRPCTCGAPIGRVTRWPWPAPTPSAFAYQALDDIADRDADRMSGRMNLCAHPECRRPITAFRWLTGGGARCA